MDNDNKKVVIKCAHCGKELHPGDYVYKTKYGYWCKRCYEVEFIMTVANGWF